EQPDRPAAELAHLSFDVEAGFLQDADDDGEGVVVGVAAALDLARRQAGVGHGPGDGLAAAVDQHRRHADGGHEADALERGPQFVGVLHDAAAELDDRQPAAESADVAEGLDQDVGFADGVIHGPVSENQNAILRGLPAVATVSADLSRRAAAYNTH